MNKKSNIKQNILQYIEFKGISKYKLYKLTGITRGFLDNFNGASEENIAKFIACFEEVNIEWLFNFKGEMIKKKGQKETLQDLAEKIISKHEDLLKIERYNDWFELKSQRRAIDILKE